MSIISSAGGSRWARAAGLVAGFSAVLSSLAGIDAKVATAAPLPTSIQEFASSAVPLADAIARDLALTAGLEAHVLSGSTPRTREASAWWLNAHSRYVSIPLTTGVSGSNIGAVVSDDGAVSQTTEIALEGNERSGSIRMWVDGVLRLDRFIDEAEAARTVSMEASSGMTTQSNFWSRWVSCMNGAGVANWVLTAVIAACSAVCVGTVGIGCAGCIGVAAGMWGGVAGTCFQRAK